MPRPAAVSLDKGQLVVRTLDVVHVPNVVYVPKAVQLRGKAHTSYQKSEILTTGEYELDEVTVYDVKGKIVSKKALPGLLKKKNACPGFDRSSCGRSAESQSFQGRHVAFHSPIFSSSTCARSE
jgi:hypothetical protein